MGLYDELAKGLGDAITDIRQKAYEEPLFGKVVTDGPTLPEPATLTAPDPSLGGAISVAYPSSAWDKAVESLPPADPQPTVEQPKDREPDHEQDR
jgi:hypothetical protein